MRPTLRTATVLSALLLLAAPPANLAGKDGNSTQEYNGFPRTNIRSGGKFHGVIREGVIAF